MKSTIVINGHVLTVAQMMTLHTALNDFSMSINEEDAPEDIKQMYNPHISAIQQMYVPFENER